MEKRSLIKNSAFNVLKTFSSIVIPFLLFPYVSRVLDVDSVGKWNYSTSFVSYFTLLATFGINEYAIRNGSRIKNDISGFKKISNQLFTLNCLFAVGSFLLLLVVTSAFQRLTSYRWLIILLGINVLISPLSLDWIYNIFEDFEYISIRAILIQVISAILIFSLVRDRDDLFWYVLISVMANTFSIIINYFHAKTHYRPQFVLERDLKKHFAGLWIFFVNSLASIIYLNSDVIILGMMSNDYTVGLYSAATKIYSITKQIFNSVILTIIPRLSFLAVNDENQFEKLLNKVISVALIFVVPATIGLFLMRSDIIYMIAGDKYSESGLTLGILAFATFFAVFANIIVNGIMVPRGHEKKVVKTTLFTALLNIVLNLFAIRIWAQNGAALTTLIAESTLLLINLYYSKNLVSKIFNAKDIRDVCIGCVAMIAVYELILVVAKALIPNLIVSVVIRVAVSCVIYFMTLLMLRNDIAWSAFKLILSKSKKFLCALKMRD